ANPSTAYLSELLVGALHGAAQHAIQLTLDTWSTLDDAAMRTAAKTIAANASGVILPPPLCESTMLIQGLRDRHVPAVAVAAGYFNNLISSVRIDDFVASREITDLVIKAGHRRIAYIKGHRQQASSARRFEGFRAALAAAGIAADPALEAQGDFTYRSGLTATEHLLALRDPPTAICAGNDDMAAAAISAAHRRGLQVPRDLSVVGFDDTPIATTVWPELTTVHQPIATMAASAVEILLQASAPDAEGTRIVVDRVMAHHLVERGSVSAPGAEGPDRA
ncbi:MAG TPA: substrate-binding domain-containing protein, partial [Rhodanobacteraceae bacterium]|nr:substrate-binding domain-containing protein [Rhodanobacteraceae bacterium]